jgi:predicted negative regulator of RcsB-dependent stress response
MTSRILGVAAITLLLASCGYFNSLYNANRRFAEAERAVLAGDAIGASRSYRAAIDGAATSYRKHPNSRWADDALLVVGRARFALREYAAAAAAMDALLAQTRDARTRGIALAHIGAARLRLGDPQAGLSPLDSAVAILPAGSDDAAFARLWRARAGFAAGRPDAWSDLLEAAGNRRTAWGASVEGVRRAAELRDSARLGTFMQSLAGARFVTGSQVEVDSTLRFVAAAWSPAVAFQESAPLQRGSWPAGARDAVAVTRVEIAQDAGELAAALELALEVAGAVTGGLGSTARFHAARIRLRDAASPEDLEEVRVILLRAFDSSRALQLMRMVRTAQVLIERGDEPATALSLFAAAELARDELEAPLLARRLFLDFAALSPDVNWAGKAVLAAHALGATDESVAALHDLDANPYVRAARGESVGVQLDRSEERLAWGIAGLRADALSEAIQRDVVVGRAVSVLDSTRAAARLDSVRIACGTLLDSLGLAGIRADSTRSACLRGDSTRVAFVLSADTTLLRDSARAEPRTIRRGVQVAPDTIPE